MRILFLCVLLFFLSVFQASFLPHLRIAGFSLNIVLLFVCLLSVAGQESLKTSILAAIVGGIFVDMFSSGFFGQWVLIFLSFALLSHFFFRRYARIPILQARR